MRRRRTTASAVAVLVAAGAAASAESGCAHGAGGGALDAPNDALHAAGVRAKADPTWLLPRGARLVPEVIDDDKGASFGIEPGGGVRAIAAGVRVVSLANGAVLTADDRLPQRPSLTMAVPERLGGGFLFVMGTVVWRADRWLAPARPLAVSGAAVTAIVPGLDRVYLRSQSGATTAIDARTGASLDLGAWPVSPYVGTYVALDGWRAVAVADLRGVVATFDAGASWRTLDLPLDAKQVIVVDAGLAIGGLDAAHATAWYEVQKDGQVTRLAGPPAEAEAAATSSAGAGASGGGGAGAGAGAGAGTTTSASGGSSSNGGASEPVAPGGKAFGKHPMLAAIEDGWPLADGTAAIARDGALARVRLVDGALVDVAPEAFPLNPARCHPVRVGANEASFGFVCGEPRGRTVVYAYDPASAKLDPLRAFDQPREVLAAGNGALAVRGGCAPDAAPDDGDRAEQTFCVMGVDRAWREEHLRGDIAGARVVALRDGRLAVVAQPHGDLASARVWFVDHGKATSVPIVFPRMAADVARAVRGGMWLEGFEERKPGVVSGWIDDGGEVMGIDLPVDGHAKLGPLLHDAGTMLVSGRYGLGWSAARRGYETVDGGATWTPLDLPEPIGGPRSAVARGCGPVGCVTQGWLRVGWGPPPPEPAPPPPATVHAAWQPSPILDLACTPMRAAPPPVPSVTIPSHTPAILDPNAGVWPSSPWAGMRPAPLATFDWTPFFSFAPPQLRTDDLGFGVETSEPVGHLPHMGPLVRFYAWGAKGVDWDKSSRWLVRWLFPYGSSQDVTSAQIVAAPRLVVDSSRFSGGVTRAVAQWKVALGDDAQHALLVARRTSPFESVPIELEADRPPVEIHRADGEPFGDIDGAVRVGGHWFLAGAPAGVELPAAIVWQVDGDVARELTRVPRAGTDVEHGSPVRLARRSDGRAVGLVVERALADHALPHRWVIGVDVATGAAGEPESLGQTDLSDRHGGVGPCNGDEPGWILDAGFPGSARVSTPGSRYPANLRVDAMRLRVSEDHVCIERLSGALDAPADTLVRPGATRAQSAAPLPPGTLELSALTARARYPLRCVRR